MQAEKKDSMRHQKKFFLSSTKILGATGATVWALKGRGTLLKRTCAA